MRKLAAKILPALAAIYGAILTSLKRKQIAANRGAGDSGGESVALC